MLDTTQAETKTTMPVLERTKIMLVTMQELAAITTKDIMPVVVTTIIMIITQVVVIKILEVDSLLNQVINIMIPSISEFLQVFQIS